MSVVLSAMVLALVASPAAAQSRAQMVKAGKALAKRHCATCHAIGARGTSPNRYAPPFRSLNTRYDLDNLQEAFVEGVAVGHRGADMPEFQFTPDATDALITYLKSLRR